MSNAIDPQAVTQEILDCLFYLEHLASLARVKQQGSCQDWFLVDQSPDGGDEVGIGVHAFWHNAKRLVAHTVATACRFYSVEAFFSRCAASDDLLTSEDCHGASFHDLAVALCQDAVYRLAPAFESGAELTLWIVNLWKAKTNPSMQDALSAVEQWSLNPSGAVQVLDEIALKTLDFNWLRAGIRKESARLVSCDDTQGVFPQEAIASQELASTNIAPAGRMSAREIAEKHGLDLEKLRRRLGRFRKTTVDGWFEDEDPTRHQPRYFYDESAVAGIVAEMKYAGA